VKMNSELLLYGGSEVATVRASFSVCCLGFMWCAFVSNYQSVCHVILVVCRFDYQYVYLKWTWELECDNGWVLLSMTMSVGYCATHYDIMLYYYKCY
jgi:hypothetical protein